MTALISVTDNSFDPEVLKCDIPVLTEFYAQWSPVCKALAPHLETIATENPERVKVVRVDIDSNPVVTSNYEVLNIPTLILFKNGQIVARLEGRQGKQSVMDAIKPFFDQ